VRQKILNEVDSFLEEPFTNLSNEYHIKNLNIIDEFAGKLYRSIIKNIHEYFIDRSNQDLTVYILHLWMTLLHDREFFDKIELISNFILGHNYEEYKIDVRVLNLLFYLFYFNQA
jgi:hypothetical protein